MECERMECERMECERMECERMECERMGCERMECERMGCDVCAYCRVVGDQCSPVLIEQFKMSLHSYSD